jgi:hypothetical protein
VRDVCCVLCRVQVGTAPNRLFVLDLDTISYSCDPLISISLQVKLFETTNVIEVHYRKAIEGPAPPSRCGGLSFPVVTGVEEAWGSAGTTAGNLSAVYYPNGDTTFPLIEFSAVRYALTGSLQAYSCGTQQLTVTDGGGMQQPNALKYLCAHLFFPAF